MAEGALVVAAARRLERRSELVAGAASDGAEALAVSCDVTDEGSVAAAVDTAVSTFGGLDAAFNNVGQGGSHRRCTKIQTAKFDSVLAANLRGPFLCIKHQIPHLIERGGGSIVLTSSIGGRRVGPQCRYAASRCTGRGWSSARPSTTPRITSSSTAIGPGPTRSEMFDRWISTEALRTAMAAQAPLNYIAGPDDMARVALFLLSDEGGSTPAACCPAKAAWSVD